MTMIRDGLHALFEAGLLRDKVFMLAVHRNYCSEWNYSSAQKVLFDMSKHEDLGFTQRVPSCNSGSYARSAKA